MNLLPIAHQQDMFLSHDLDCMSIPYDLINSIIVPRPIAFITTKGENGVVNAAPFSYFNVVCKQPVLISVSIGRRKGERKDTACNILLTKEFVVNICTPDLIHAINLASQDLPSDISEIEKINLSLLPSEKISPPRIANTLVQMECIHENAIGYGEEESKGDLFIGKVIKTHIHKDILNQEGYIDIKKFNPLARLSGQGYAKIIDL